MTRGVECRLLEWDSDFFRLRIGRVEAAKLDSAGMRSVHEFARAEAIECLYYLVDERETDSIRAAEAGGFRRVDVRVTRVRSLESVPIEIPSDQSSEIDVYREGDLSRLRSIARTSHGDSRFYHDSNFSRERCGALYEKWISNACVDRPGGVLVARKAGDAVGYLTCDIDESGTGTIGLVAVDESERGQQWGRRLVRSALSWFANHDRKDVRVVSQARNRASARLYESEGFRTSAIERWYHLWPGSGAAE